MPEQSEFVAGGYFLVKSVARSEWYSADLLPERLVSLSSECIVPSVQVYWSWEDQKAVAFGIPEALLTATHQEIPDFDFPNVFLKLAAARDFIDRFLPDHDSLHLLGIGLPRGLVDTFLQANPQRIYDPNKGKHEFAEYGTNTVLRTGEPLSLGGQILGYEVLSYNYQLSHSWLCSGLEREMHTLFSIRPNAHGFIGTLEEAMQVYEWIAEDEQKGHRAEPEPYYPWLVVEYPLKATREE